MHDAASYFALFVLVFLFLVFVALIVWIGSLPKQIAEKRQHPQVDAINACSWIGLALGGIGWPIAFVWAFLHAGPIGHETVPTVTAPAADAEVAKLKARIAELEAQLGNSINDGENA